MSHLGKRSPRFCKLVNPSNLGNWRRNGGDESRWGPRLTATPSSSPASDHAGNYNYANAALEPNAALPVQTAAQEPVLHV